MTIDTHVHLYDPTRPEGVPWPDRVRRYFAAHGSRAAARYFGANAARIYRWPGAEDAAAL